MATSGAGSAPEGTDPPEGAQDQPGAQVDGEGAEVGTAAAPTDELSKVRREAAQRRVQLRETEAKLEQATAQITAFQRTHVEGLVADWLTDPADLWKGDVELASLLNDEGVVDEAKVTEAVKAVAEAHPAWIKKGPDFGAGARGTDVESNPVSFGQAMKEAASGRDPVRR